jgi:modulator of FtsH protease HflC
MSGKNMLRVVVGLLIGGILVAVMITYQVRFTEAAVVETLGKLAPEPVGAGLHARWPWPIQRITKYPTSLQHFETAYEQLQTSDVKSVMVNAYVCWRVKDPIKFRQVVGDQIEDGETYIRGKVGTAVQHVVGKSPMDAFASLDKEKVKLEAMEDEVLKSAKADTESQYGVEIVLVGIQRMGLPEEVSKTVMDNMRSERTEKAEKARSQGTAAAQSITSEADSIAGQVLSFARLRADQIKAQGQAEAAKYFKQFGQHEWFAMFLRRLEYLRETLTDGMFILDGTQYDESNGWFRSAPVSPDAAKPASPAPTATSRRVGS